MAAGNVTAGVYQNHQHRPNGQRGQAARAAGVDDHHAHREHKQKHSNEFNQVFFHMI